MFLVRRDVYFKWKDVLFQLVRCIFPIWRPPYIPGGRQLENEMYISSGKMYISSTSHQLKYTSFHLKYTSHSLSGGRQIGIIHLNS